MTRFDALEVAFQIVAAIRPLLPRIAAHDATLARQLRDSSHSIPGNLAEGRRRLGRDRIYHWSIAAGSTDESLGWLRLAVAAGYVDEPAAQPALALLDRDLAITWRLTHK